MQRLPVRVLVKRLQQFERTTKLRLGLQAVAHMAVLRTQMYERADYMFEQTHANHVTRSFKKWKARYTAIKATAKIKQKIRKSVLRQAV